MWKAGGEVRNQCRAAAVGAGRIRHEVTLAAYKDCGPMSNEVCVDTVEAGFMTKDLALLVGADQRWLSTTGFLDKVADNLEKAMA